MSGAKIQRWNMYGHIFARFLGTLKREIPEESVQGIFD